MLVAFVFASIGFTKGVHYWEVSETDINLVEGQSEYIFFRATSDGTSAVTTPANTYGVADVLEATIRTNRTAVNQADSALTKISRSTYKFKQERFIILIWILD